MTTFEGLFYAETPKFAPGRAQAAARLTRAVRGEYANLIKAKENVDMHLLVTQLSRARLESAPGRGNYERRAADSLPGRALIPRRRSHIVRVHNLAGEVCISFFLMWPEQAPRGQYAPGQVEAFQALRAKHGEEVNFLL